MTDRPLVRHGISNQIAKYQIEMAGKFVCAAPPDLLAAAVRLVGWIDSQVAEPKAFISVPA